MSFPVPNDLPHWIQAFAESGAFGLALWQTARANRQAWAFNWAQLVEDLSGLSGDDVRAVVDANPKIVEMVGHAWEAAMRSGAEEKRRHLAAVVAAALRDPDDDVQLDRLQFFLRTTVALEPPHVRLLVLIGTARPGKGQMMATIVEGGVSPAEIHEMWPQSGALTEPMIKTLANEGLIEDVGVRTYDGSPAWSVTRYGQQWLSFVGEMG